jgi:hypothetical protein
VTDPKEQKIEFDGELSLSDLGREATKHLSWEECDTVDDPDRQPAPTVPEDTDPKLVYMRVMHKADQHPETRYMAESTGPVCRGWYRVGAITSFGRSIAKCEAEMRFRAAQELYNTGQIEDWSEARDYMNDFEFRVQLDK